MLSAYLLSSPKAIFRDWSSPDQEQGAWGSSRFTVKPGASREPPAAIVMVFVDWDLGIGVDEKRDARDPSLE